MSDFKLTINNKKRYCLTMFLDVIEEKCESVLISVSAITCHYHNLLDCGGVTTANVTWPITEDKTYKTSKDEKVINQMRIFRF